MILIDFKSWLLKVRYQYKIYYRRNNEQRIIGKVENKLAMIFNVKTKNQQI